MTQDVSVVICAYTLDRWADIERSVRSAVEQEPAPDEVIVVADHNEELLSRLRTSVGERYPTQPVRVVPNIGARGLSGARNTGVKASRSSVVAFLDDDAVAEPGWVRALGEAYADPRVIACGGAVEPRFAGAAPSWLPEEFYWVIGCSYRGQPTEAADVRNVIGANMSMRRDAIVAAGGFPEDVGRVGTVPVGCEETFLCIRMAQLDPSARVLFDPRARVGHTVTDQRLTREYFVSRCYAEGLSKAIVASRLGSDDGLGSERSYTLRALPRGALRNLADVMRGDMSGVSRLAVMIVGLAVTAAGYARGTLRRSTGSIQPVGAAA